MIPFTEWVVSRWRSEPKTLLHQLFWKKSFVLDTIRNRLNFQVFVMHYLNVVLMCLFWYFVTLTKFYLLAIYQTTADYEKQNLTMTIKANRTRVLLVESHCGKNYTWLGFQPWINCENNSPRSCLLSRWWPQFAAEFLLSVDSSP